MNQTEISEKAKDLVDRAEESPNKVAEELRDMSKEDRQAVVDKIKANQAQRPSDELPVLEFYDSNNLKKVTDKDTFTHKPSTVESNTYEDGTGAKTRRTIETSDGYKGRTEFNPKTGRFKEEEVTFGNGDKGIVYDRGEDKMGSVDYDAGGRVTRTSEDTNVEKGEAVRRNFGYDEDGKLNRIDGQLGHWDRHTGKDGKTYWQNTDKNVIWNGDFKVDSKGNLHFDSHTGQDYKFTANGKSIRV
jgi:hypothetical protein